MEAEALKFKSDNALRRLPILFVAFSVISAVLMFTFDQSAVSVDDRALISDGVTLSVFVAVALFCAVARFNNKLTAETVISAVVTVGFALRLAYALRYGYFEHQHDVESLKSSGHLSYIYRLSLGQGLPDTNEWQFSHPPLHHYIAAGVVALSKAVGCSEEAAFENIQLLTVLYSTLIIFISAAVFKECGLRGKTLTLSTSIIAFHPGFFILAGSINNDCLSILLSLAAIYMLIKWCKKKTVLNAALIGLFTGLGMMTKFSASLTAVIVAVTVIVKFITDKQRRLSDYLLQTAVFLAVMLPLGLWFQIRNMLLFGQPIGYVAPIGTDSPLYIGDISIVKRILLPFSVRPVGVFADVWSEFNLWTYLLRNSLFNEYSFGNAAAAFFSVICNLCLIASSLAAMMLSLKRKNRIEGASIPIIGLAWTVQVISFIYLNLAYPFGCSMDSRYIMLTPVCGAAFVGVFLQKQCEVYSRLKPVGMLTETVTVLFAVLSAVTFL